MFNLLIRKNKDRDLDFFNDNLFSDFFRKPFISGHNTMRTDFKEEENRYLLDIELPGLNKEDIKLSYEDGYLTVGVEKSENTEQKDEAGNYIRRERYYGNCSRSFYVGPTNEADITAAYNNGILNITVPKAETVDKKKIITIK